MKSKYKILALAFIILSNSVLIINAEDIQDKTYIPTIEDNTKVKIEAECVDNPKSYTPNIGESLFTVYSKVQFSPDKLDYGWITGDHIGEKDTAFNGERHVAVYNPGVIMFGYDALPHGDFMLKNFGSGDKTINVVQGPYQVDWHTFNGNGIIFNATLTKDLEPGDYLPGKTGTSITNGYFLCATQSELKLIQLSGISLDSLMDNSENITELNTLWKMPKQCSAQNFTVVVKGTTATGYLGQLKLFEVPVNDGNYCGLLSCYAAHNCSKLSSIYFSNFTYNGKDYLKK